MEDKMLLRPMEQKSIVDRIIARMIDAIMSGTLAPGERIPTETELAESMGVGRNSVREAIKALVAMGVLIIRRADGTFVADGFNERMLDPMVYGLILEGGTTPAVLELRSIFEIGILQLAIEKATGEDIERLRACLDYLKRMARDNPANSEAILMADIAFHDELQRIADNSLAEKISFVIERVARSTREGAVKMFIDKDELDDMILLHEKLFDIVQSRDKSRIVDAIDDHFRYWKNMLN